MIKLGTRLHSKYRLCANCTEQGSPLPLGRPKPTFLQYVIILNEFGPIEPYRTRVYIIYTKGYLEQQPNIFRVIPADPQAPHQVEDFVQWKDQVDGLIT